MQMTGQQAVQERPTFVVYRILGNDLPPRHRVGQTLDALRFILAHELPLAGCEKRWVLNRIVDPATEAEAARLIADAGHPAVRIPFSLDAYAAEPYAYSGLTEAQHFHAAFYLALNDRQKAPLVDRYLSRRSRYAVNVNGARNRALADGIGDARWVLPLDGQLFLSADAWAAIRAAAAAAEADGSRYLILPAARLADTGCLLAGGPLPAADQEPAIAFRDDAQERFDPSLHYGFADKAALLARLGVTGAWSPSERARVVGARPGPSPDAGRYRWAGRLARLPSGNAEADLDDAARVHSRFASLFRFLHDLDERTMLRGWQVGTPLLFRGPGLAREAASLSDRAVAGDRTGLSDLAPGILAAAVAAAVTGDGAHAGRCADRLRAAGLDRKERWQHSTIAAAVPLAFLLDAAVIARGHGALAEAEMDELRNQARAMLDGLTSGPRQPALCAARDADGTWYEVLVLGLAAFVGDLGAMRAVLERLPPRILQQFAADGSQPAEAAGDGLVVRMIANLEGWACLARMAAPLGHDPWQVQSEGGNPLGGALRHAVNAIGRAAPADRDRLRRRVATVVQLSPWRRPRQPPAERGMALAELDPANVPGLALLLVGDPAA